MKPTNIYKKVGVSFISVVLLSLVFSSLTPSTAFAQQDPGAGGVSSWMNRLFGGSNLGDTAPTQSGTSIPGIPQIVVDIVMGGGQSEQPTNTSNPTGGFSVNNISGIITNVYNNPLESAGNVIQGGLGLVVNMLNGVGTFVEDPISSTINGVVGAYVEIGNQLQWWSNDGNLTGTTFGDPVQAITGIIEAVVNAVLVEPVVGAVNLLTGGVNGEPAGGDALSPGSQAGGSTSNGARVIQGGQTLRFSNGESLTLRQGETATINPNGDITINLTNGHTMVITSEGYATEYNAQGEPINSNDPGVNPGNWDGSAGNSNGPSIPGASKGTVGNPFSDGTDKDDAKSSNKEDQSNPYLFEYDPSSTNNNPSGDGAIEQ